jgi:hypothetical protein
MNKVCPYLSIQTPCGGKSSITEELGMVAERWHRIKLSVRYQGGGGPRPLDPEDDMNKVCPYLSIQTPCGGKSSIIEELGRVGEGWYKTELKVWC